MNKSNIVKSNTRINNSNNYNNSNNIDNSYLFFKLYKNIIIKNEIIYHLKLYNNHFYQRSYNIQIKSNNSNNNKETINDFYQYKFKEYFKSIKLILNEDNKDIIIPLISDNNNHLLPSNIDTLELVDDYQLTGQNYFKSSLPIISKQIKHLKLKISNIVINNSDNKIISDTIESLYLSNSFNQSLILNDGISSIFPTYGLTVLVFGSNFNQPIKPNILPVSLTKLDLGQRYSYPLEINSIPPNVTILELSYFYNSPLEIGVFPNQLKQLVIKGLFNQMIEPNVLPKSLKSLVFGQFCKFNKPLKEHSLPPNLEILTFKGDFNQPLNNQILPNNLKKLSLSQKFDQDINNCSIINSTSNILTTTTTTTTITKTRLPESITILNLSSKIKNLELNLLPIGLKHLILSNNIVISKESFLECNNLIKVSGCNLKHIESLPSFIEKIKFHECFEDIIPIGTFNKFINLKSINFGLVYNQPIPNNLIPNSVVSIKLKGLFNQSIPVDDFKHSLSILQFGEYFNKFNYLSNLLNLIKLKLYITSNQNNNQNNLKYLPNSIKELTINIIDDNNHNNIDSNNNNINNIIILNHNNLPKYLIKLIIIGNPIIELPLPSTIESIYVQNDNISILKNFQLFNQLKHLIKVLDCNNINKI